MTRTPPRRTGQQHYIVKCEVCDKVIEKSKTILRQPDRELRYSLCGVHRPRLGWRQ